MHLVRLLFFLYFVSLLSTHTTFAAASSASSTSSSSSSTYSSSSSYNVYHYDQARHFTPDGRLLQVEYAMAAAERSSPLILCQLDSDTLVVMSCTKPTTTKATNLPHKRPQDRIVIVEDNVVVAMSGFLADCVAVFKAATQAWQEWKTTFGDVDDYYYGYSSQEDSQQCLQVMANAMGNACHENCFQGGIRPYGATMLLIGMGSTYSGNNNNKEAWKSIFRVIQTDPSGAVMKIPLPPPPQQQQQTEQDKDDLRLVKIIGGSPDVRLKMEKAIQKLQDEQHRVNNNSIFSLRQRSTNSQSTTTPTTTPTTTTTTTLWQKLESLTKVLLQEQDEETFKRTSTTASKIFRFKNKKSKPTESSQSQQQPSSSTSSWSMEVVLVSRTLGIHRLQNSKAQELLKQVIDDVLE